MYPSEKVVNFVGITRAQYNHVKSRGITISLPTTVADHQHNDSTYLGTAQPEQLISRVYLGEPPHEAQYPRLVHLIAHGNAPHYHDAIPGTAPDNVTLPIHAPDLEATEMELLAVDPALTGHDSCGQLVTADGQGPVGRALGSRNSVYLLKYQAFWVDQLDVLFK